MWVLGLAFLMVLSLFGMDLIFERIPSCIQNGVVVAGENCLVEYAGSQEWSFYDPTIPEPERWKASPEWREYLYGYWK